jgi:transposase
MVSCRDMFSTTGATRMHDDHTQVRRDWRLPDALWDRIEPWLPPRKPHPLGCHRPRVDDRQAMDAICLVLRTGCPWHALHETGLCSSSSAHRRVQEWAAAGVLLTWWTMGLADDDAVHGMDWEWRAMDGAMTTAPLGGEQGGPEPHRPWPTRHQAPCTHRRRRRAYRPRRGGRPPP